MKPTSPCVLAAAASSMVLALAAPTGAAAITDSAASVDARIRPHFGLLLDPPVRRHKPARPHYKKHKPYKAYPLGPGGGYGSSITVDCADASLGPTPISDAARYVEDGGVVYVRSRGAACTETIEIDHPVIIAGEAASAFDPSPSEPYARLSPLKDAPCVRVAPGVKGVELRDLTVDAPAGGRASCIEAWDGELALVRVAVRYTGDASAVYVGGGRLIMRDSEIDARSYDAAVVADDTVLDIVRTRITTDYIALDVTPARDAPSTLTQVGLLSGSGQGGTAGVLVRGVRSGAGTLTIRNAVICGWRTALWLDRGASAEIARSRLCADQNGVSSGGGDLVAAESSISAGDVGVYADGGRARVERNRIYGVGRAGIWAERGVDLSARDNWVYWNGDCPAFNLGPGQICFSERETPWGLYGKDAYAGPNSGGGQPYGQSASGHNSNGQYANGQYANGQGYASAPQFAAPPPPMPVAGPGRGWTVDGYDQGFIRDGAPGYVAPPLVPQKKPWWR